MILSGQPSRNKGLILLVDDEEIVLDVGSQMLEKIGYSVIRARNGKEAIALFREHKAQVNMVILDLRMPEMDGECAYELLKEIKPDVKVLISSESGHRQIPDYKFHFHALLRSILNLLVSI